MNNNNYFLSRKMTLGMKKSIVLKGSVLEQQ